MKRIDRIKLEIDYTIGKISILDLFDNAIISILRVTQDEYDKIFGVTTNKEMDRFIYLIKQKDWNSKKELLILIENFYKYIKN